jgi:hypothetical protein
LLYVKTYKYGDGVNFEVTFGIFNTVGICTGGNYEHKSMTELFN